jgi:hypothetical protein
MLQPLPFRLSDGGRTATWNPALTFAREVVLRVVLPGGAVEERRSLNSGRARVRGEERIRAVLADELLG